VLDLVVKVGGMQQCFGRNTASQKTGSTEILVLFDESCAQAQLSGAHRRNVAARTSPDDGHVKRFFG
jgi:hypothetical protein